MTRLPRFPESVWINSKPLKTDDLAGRVVAVDFWTYTCVNWLRTLPYLRAWWDKYRDDGLLLIGVHTPEFSFEHNEGNVRQAVQDMGISYPVVIDNEYAIWRAFANHYWPALYIADETGHIRHYWYGEGGYEESERAIQRMLAASRGLPSTDIVTVKPSGLEIAADFKHLQSYESYLGYQKATGFASPGEPSFDQAYHYRAPDRLNTNQWALEGDWTITSESSVLNEAGGRLVDSFHARDLNLVMRPTVPGRPVPFRVLLDGKPPDKAHGSDTSPNGSGIASEPRTYQLVRQRGPISDRRFEIEFLKSGIEAVVLTFG
jgi:hypothetical protein